MTIQEVQALAATLETQLTALLQAFESTTGCLVHSVPVVRDPPTSPVVARVKVQIP